jgi:hypothetical protein
VLLLDIRAIGCACVTVMKGNSKQEGVMGRPGFLYDVGSSLLLLQCVLR